jgi:hypothetical protein
MVQYLGAGEFAPDCTGIEILRGKPFRNIIEPEIHLSFGNQKE